MQRLLVASVAAGTLIFQVACYGSGFSLPDNRQSGTFALPGSLAVEEEVLLTMRPKNSKARTSMSGVA